MPLNAQKAAHIIAVTNKSFAARQTTVVFVYASAGVYSYVATSVIFRFQEVVDPEIPDPSGGSPKIIADAVIVAPITTNFVGLVYVAYTSTATAGAVAAARKYELINAVPTGIVPGGTHYICDLRRMR